MDTGLILLIVSFNIIYQISERAVSDDIYCLKFIFRGTESAFYFLFVYCMPPNHISPQNMIPVTLISYKNVQRSNNNYNKSFRKMHALSHWLVEWTSIIDTRRTSKSVLVRSFFIPHIFLLFSHTYAIKVIDTSHHICSNKHIFRAVHECPKAWSQFPHSSKRCINNRHPQFKRPPMLFKWVDKKARYSQW